MEDTKKKKKSNLIRLKDTEYDRPKITYTEKLNKNPNNIIDKLEDYIKVDSIYKVPLGTHLRYYKNDNGKKKFVLGGKLINNKGLPKYIVLTNGKFTWSVQLDTIIAFFRKMTIKEIKEDYEEMIMEMDQKNTKLKQNIKDQQKEINRLKFIIDGIKKNIKY